MCSFVTPQCHRCLKLRERAIAMLMQECPPELLPENRNVNLSTISHLQHRFKEFGTTSNWPHNFRPRVWRHLVCWCQHCEQISPVGLWHGYFNAERHSDEILSLIVVPFIRRHHLMFPHDNAWPHDWFPYMDCNFEMFEMVPCWVYIFVQYNGYFPWQSDGEWKKNV